MRRVCRAHSYPAASLSRRFARSPIDALAAAGQMAAKLFTAQAWLSIACAMFLLLVYNQKESKNQDIRAQEAIKFIVTGLLLAVLVEFGLSPRIVGARAEGGDLKLLHGLGSAMYLGQWLCAGFAIWRLSQEK